MLDFDELDELLLLTDKKQHLDPLLKKMKELNGVLFKAWKQIQHEPASACLSWASSGRLCYRIGLAESKREDYALYEFRVWSR